jgi:VWFA-related protein
MTCKRPFLTIVSIIVAAQLTIAGQSQSKPADQDQSIRLKSDLIEMRVVVTDRKGQIVDNLKQEDFEIISDGRPQSISFFSVERIKGRSTGAAPQHRPAPPAATAPAARTAPTPARTIVLFVDNIHLPTFSFMRVKQHLKRFVDEQLTDQDLAAIVPTYGNLGALQQFMRDRKMLKTGIDKLSPFNRDNSLFTPYLAARATADDDRAIQAGLQILIAEEAYQPLSPESSRAYVQARATQIISRETNLRKATLGTLRAVCDRMAEMPGQRMIILISDGFTMQEHGGGADNESLRSVGGRASRSGVVIYSLEAKGLTVSPELNAANPGINSFDLSRFSSESEYDSQDSLKTLAYSTGGEAFLRRNDLAMPFKKILDDNNTYYVIAYYSADDKENKKYRDVSIKVKGHPEYNVRAPKGYMPAVVEKTEVALTPRQKLLRAMLTPLPATGIAVSSSADYLESQADEAQVTLQLIFDAGTIRHNQEAEKYHFDCEIAVAAYDASGNIADSFAENIKGTVTARQLEEAKKTGYRYSKRMKLKPGLYQLRSGVRDAGSELLGTSMTWVEVPDLNGGKLALSTIYLGREPGAKEKVRQTRAASNAAQPRPVDDKAILKSGDVIVYRLVAYNAAAKEAGKPPVMVKTDILQGEKVVFEGAWQDITSRVIRKDNKGMEIGGRMSIELPPGTYELKVSVKEGKSKKLTERTVIFEMEP